jgi:NRAMP (natural resistance-associated macrophage protein)-like metal ion transporter
VTIEMAENPTTVADEQARVAAQAGASAQTGVPPVLDEAHIGDIRGALGTIKMDDANARHDWRSRAMALLAIMGPGLIVMVGDNDAGGVSTYAQAGQNYGTTLLWTLILLIPVLIVNQEMVIRLGAVTGVGHARLINERFGRFWGWFSVGDLFVLNFLTIVTEFIGVSLALGYFGVSRYIAVPLAGAALVGITSTGSFRSWERFMYVFVAANFLVIPLLFMVHPSAGAIAHDTFVPSIQGGASSTAVLLIIAIVGTTVAPWQLFFQQSNIIDKRITPRWINYERTDTVIGAFVVVLGAGAMIAVAAFAFGGTPLAGQFANAGAVASGLRHYVSPTAGAFFAVVLLNASMIGAASVTLATSYAFGDVFGASHSLHRGIKDAKLFYATFTAMVAAAAGIVLLPGAPLGLITTSVQALAGVLLPSATVFLLLLCNDRDVLGPWVNGRKTNVFTSAVIAVLITLSVVLTASVMFPAITAGQMIAIFAACAAVSVTAGAGMLLRRRGGAASEVNSVTAADRNTWRMPPLAELGTPVISTTRKVGLAALRGYLFIAMILVIVKIVLLAVH